MPGMEVAGGWKGRPGGSAFCLFGSLCSSCRAAPTVTKGRTKFGPDAARENGTNGSKSTLVLLWRDAIDRGL
jgi:hypothetical protein